MVIDTWIVSLQSIIYKIFLAFTKHVFILIFTLPVAAVSAADQDMSTEQLDRWFEQNESSSTELVSEGELRFLLKQPVKPALHSLNSLTIYEKSLDDGWVGLSQCYQNLDPVAESEVVYHYRYMQDLVITSSKNIADARIEGQSIQLIDVQKNAELCITAKVRIFYQNQDGSFSLVNGPFHRKFLDGYYPYHLTLEVSYPEASLSLMKTVPAEQPGFRLDKQAGKILLDGIFEGILNIEIVFVPK